MTKILEEKGLKLGASSRSSGFLIRDNRGRTVESKGYGKEIGSNKEDNRWALIYWSPITEWSEETLKHMEELFGISDTQILEKEMSRIKGERDEWHAIEHMLVNALRNLEDGQKFTLELIESASMISSGCGGDNRNLKKPSQEKLIEALEVGREYLRLILSPSFF